MEMRMKVRKRRRKKRMTSKYEPMSKSEDEGEDDRRKRKGRRMRKAPDALIEDGEVTEEQIEEAFAGVWWIEVNEEVFEGGEDVEGVVGFGETDAFERVMAV